MLSVPELVKKSGDSLLDLLFPSHCIGCDRRLETEERGICPPCFARIPKNIPPFCPTCGRNYAGTPKSPRCGECEGKRPPFREFWYVSPYEGMVRELLHAFKYEGKKSLAIPLTRLLTTFIQQHLHAVSFDEVLPVPLSRRKERERTFNQSALLAKGLARHFSLPLSLDNLIRVRETLPQIHLPREKRVENVQGAFHVKNPSLVVRKRLLLIDDVATTGATLTSCAQVLLDAGAKAVSALTFARG